jgi:zinc finger protein
MDDDAAEEEELMANAEELGIDVIKNSLCVECEGTGTTKIIMHDIPYFRKLFIASFECDDCGERNNEVTFGGEIQLHGCRYELKVTSPKDLDRQIIKSDFASVKILDLDFEIPPMTQKGEISTLEGFLRTAARNLGLCQEERMRVMPEVGAKVQEVIVGLTMYATGINLPFTIHVDDPSGNSFIENPHAPKQDPSMRIGFYQRTADQDVALGLQPEKGTYKDDKETNYKALMTHQFGADDSAVDDSTGEGGEAEDEVNLGRSEAVGIPCPCPACGFMGETLTALTDIPHFKEVIIMAFDCSSCGYRNSEVKGGGSIPSLGTMVTLCIHNREDLKRDVLKSDSAAVEIPEFELELGYGTLGGVYTTIEGLLNKIHTQLKNSNPFAIGDSVSKHHGEQSETKRKFEDLLDKIKAASLGEALPITLCLRDPLGNSFISAPLGSFMAPEADQHLTVADFERTYEENEDFGLNDINTKDYETGVDHDTTQKVLPDRVTHVVRKGPDHPMPFAQGTMDATPGGVFFANKEGGSTPATNTEASQYGEGYWDTTQITGGWRAARSDDLAEELSEAISSTGAGSDDRRESLQTIREEDEGVAGETEYDAPTKRVIDLADLELKYKPYEEFSGAKAGFVFRMGAQGLGYYEDVFWTKHEKQGYSRTLETSGEEGGGESNEEQTGAN